MPLFMREAVGIALGADDDVTHGVAPHHPTDAHRARVGGGQTALRKGDIPAEGCTEVPAHVGVPCEDVQRVARRTADIVDVEVGRATPRASPPGPCQWKTSSRVLLSGDPMPAPVLFAGGVLLPPDVRSTSMPAPRLGRVSRCGESSMLDRAGRGGRAGTASSLGLPKLAWHRAPTIRGRREGARVTGEGSNNGDVRPFRVFAREGAMTPGSATCRPRSRAPPRRSTPSAARSADHQFPFAWVRTRPDERRPRMAAAPGAAEQCFTWASPRRDEREPRAFQSSTTWPVRVVDRPRKAVHVRAGWWGTHAGGAVPLATATSSSSAPDQRFAFTFRLAEGHAVCCLSGV